MEIAEFDTAILNKLHPQIADMRAVRKERMIIGFRNEQCDIYRLIGVSDVGLFLNAINKMAGLNLIDELEFLNYAKDGCDVIFSAR